MYLKSQGSTFAKTGSIDKRRIFFFGNHRIRQSACKANIFNTPKSIFANWFFTNHCYFSQVNNYPIAYCHFCTKRLLEACWSTCKQTLRWKNLLVFNKHENPFRIVSFSFGIYSEWLDLLRHAGDANTLAPGVSRSFEKIIRSAADIKHSFSFFQSGWQNGNSLACCSVRLGAYSAIYSFIARGRIPWRIWTRWTRG